MIIGLATLKAVGIEITIAILALMVIAAIPEPRKRRGPWDRY